jgi:hypothetical protein
MFPIVTRFAMHMIDGARGEFGGRPIEPVCAPSAKPQRRRGAERHPEHMIEDRTVLVPANPRADAILDDKRLFERSQSGIASPRAKLPV